jgi:deoxyribose-phosphate aldolase
MTARAPDPGTIASPRDLAPYLDHTLLAPGAGRADVDRVCEEAREHRFAGVCVYGRFIGDARRALAGTDVRAIAVADFPRGEGTTAARVAEVGELVRAGAQEVDVVAPLPLVIAGRWEAALEDLRAVVEAAAVVPVKVILETALLGREAKVAAAALARCAGATYVKTSTGFGGGGATVEDVRLLRAVVGDALGVKASGGVRSAADALAMIRAGTSRIGTSASVQIVTGTF